MVFFLPLRRLSSGKLQDLGISDGSKLTLVPTVEAGLMVRIIIHLICVCFAKRPGGMFGFKIMCVNSIRQINVGN